MLWTPQERQAIKDATDFLRTRVPGDGFSLEPDRVDPNSIILGLIVVADYAIGIAAEATSSSRAETIDRIAVAAGVT